MKTRLRAKWKSGKTAASDSPCCKIPCTASRTDQLRRSLDDDHPFCHERAPIHQYKDHSSTPHSSCHLNPRPSCSVNRLSRLLELMPDHSQQQLSELRRETLEL